MVMALKEVNSVNRQTFVHKLATTRKKSANAPTIYLINCELLVGASGFEPPTSRSRMLGAAKTFKYLPFSKVAATKDSRVLHPFPFLTIRYRLSAENSVHKLATTRTLS